MSRGASCRVCARELPAGRVAACRFCGFTWLGDTGSVFDYEAAYDEKAAYNALPPAAILDHYRQAPNTAWALAHLARLGAREGPGSLVELGSSQGAFLALARDLGFAARGIELASRSVEYGHRHLGLSGVLEQGRWRSRRPDEEPVRAVCAFEVLEHSRDPLGFLRMASSWLSPGGWLLLSVPNGRRLAVRLGRREPQDHPPHHLMYWTRRSLRLAVERIGLRVLETRTSRLTHSDLLAALAPGLSARRAADLGSLRPVDSQPAGGGLPGWLATVYPLFVTLGRTAAGCLSLVPELGSRLMLLAEKGDGPPSGPAPATTGESGGS